MEGKVDFGSRLEDITCHGAVRGSRSARQLVLYIYSQEAEGDERWCSDPSALFIRSGPQLKGWRCLEWIFLPLLA